MSEILLNPLLFFPNARKVYNNLHLIENQLILRSDNRQKSGIYIIFNRIDGKFFIGSAITNRFNMHFRNHCINGTGSPSTRDALLCHGLANFSFIIYEYFPGIILKNNLKKEHLKLLTLESQLILSLKPAYNLPSHSLCPPSLGGLGAGGLGASLKGDMYHNSLKTLLSKPVTLFDSESGEELSTYPSIRALSKFLSCSNKTLNNALKKGTPIFKKYLVKFPQGAARPGAGQGQG